MRWRQVMLAAGALTASLLTAVPAAPAGLGDARRAHSAASRTECCFVVTVRASGRISADFGQDYTTQQRVGSESYTWQWGTRELLEYTEFGGRPSLERPLNRRFQPTPSLRQAGSWVAQSDEAVVYDHSKMPPPGTCLVATSIPARIQDTQYNEVMRLRDSGTEVRARFAGHKFVMRLLGDANVLPFEAPCLDTHVVGQLEAPPLPNGEPDEKHRPMGSRPYYLTLPPQGFLRQSHGAKQTVKNHYAENISFTHGGSPTATSNLHKVMEKTQVTATFHWFPRSRLAKNVQRLRDEASK